MSKMRLSRLQNSILLELQEAGSENLATLLNTTFNPAPKCIDKLNIIAFYVALKELIKDGVVQVLFAQTRSIAPDAQIEELKGILHGCKWDGKTHSWSLPSPWAGTNFPEIVLIAN